MTFADGVLDGLGPTFRDRAGALLTPLVVALVAELEHAYALVSATGRNGWAGAFDLDTTPQPGWLGKATGTVVPDGLTVEQQREYVRTRPQWRRGTPGAVTGAVKPVLTGTQRVDLIERDGSAGVLTVRTYAVESAAGAAAIKAAATTQKPVGIVVNAHIATGATYRHMRDERPTYTDAALAYPTFDDAVYHVPEEGTHY